MVVLLEIKCSAGKIVPHSYLCVRTASRNPPVSNFFTIIELNVEMDT